MFEFFDMIADVLDMAISFFVNIIQSLISMIEMLLTLPVLTNTMVGVLPGMVGGFAMAFISIRIIYTIVGR